MNTKMIRQSFTTSNGIFNSSGADGNIHGHLDKLVFTNTSWGNGSVVISDADLQAFTFTTISGTVSNPHQR